MSAPAAGHDATQIPAVVVAAPAAGSLGLVRSLSRARVPVILLDADFLSPARHTRLCRKIAIGRASGGALVRALLDLGASLGERAVLFPASDDAALTVSEHREDLARYYRFRLPSHNCLTSLMHKTSFQHLAESHGFPVPRAAVIRSAQDLGVLGDLRFPCIVKPPRATADYVTGGFARAYKLASREAAEAMCRRVLDVVPELVVQEWIEGADSDLYFCLQYRGPDGRTVASFTGRKLSIWPPDIGVTASCTAAPEVRPILQPLTEAFFDRVSFVGMGGIEFKREATSGRFVLIEPTVGRIDAQEEVATMHGINIPLAAYRYETGAGTATQQGEGPPVIWRDFVAHWRAVRRSPTPPAALPPMAVYDAYWRRDDPLPMMFYLLGGSLRALRKSMRRIRPKR